MFTHSSGWRGFWDHPAWWLIAGFFSTVFGAGFQSIAILAFLQPFFLLRFVQLVQDSSEWKWGLVAWFSQSVAMTFAFLGAFELKSPTTFGVLSVFLLSLLYWLALGPAFFWSEKFAFKFSRSQIKSFGLPLYVAGVWQLFSTFSPIGAFAHPALAFETLDAFLQMASVFGLPCIIFLTVWAATLLHFALTDGRSLRGELHCFLVFFLVLLTFGSARQSVFSDRFPQKDITDIQRPFIPASCVLGFNDTSALMLGTTEAKLKKGAKFVLWSEDSAVLHGDAEEEALLESAKLLAVRYTAVIGTAYLKIKSPTGAIDSTRYNVFSLVSHENNGTVLFKYHKSHPVPGVESGVVAGPSTVPVATVKFADKNNTLHSVKVAGSICFDMDFPLYIQQAGRQGVELFIQPSANWGPIGYLHMASNRMRTIENGFTLYRCCSEGVSGLVDSYGTNLASVTTPQRHHAGFDTDIPLQSKTFTLYPYTFDAFGWVTVLGGVVFVLLVFMSETWLMTALPRFFVVALDEHALPMSISHNLLRDV